LYGRYCTGTLVLGQNFARRPGIWCCKTANSTMRMQNVARFDRNGKSNHAKICLSVVHICTEKGSAQDGLVMEKASFWLQFSQKNYLPAKTQTPYFYTNYLSQNLHYPQMYTRTPRDIHARYARRSVIHKYVELKFTVHLHVRYSRSLRPLYPWFWLQ
jgi:hypothetical protein